MDNSFKQEKLLPRLSFNPRLVLTGFRTTRPCAQFSDKASCFSQWDCALYWDLIIHVISNSDYRTQPFSELHDTERLLTTNNNMATTNLPICIYRKIFFLPTDLRVIMTRCRATWKICVLTRLIPSSSYKTFFHDDAGYRYLLLNASGRKYMQLSVQKS